mmetsp:Transcript_33655/g.78607  ORF Transcript_33655/g.78607 Transcript_33655/m.78607 type:complete len:238 (-) Transcript_33655:18-731(-)
MMPSSQGPSGLPFSEIVIRHCPTCFTFMPTLGCIHSAPGCRSSTDSSAVNTVGSGGGPRMVMVSSGSGSRIPTRGHPPRNHAKSVNIPWNHESHPRALTEISRYHSEDSMNMKPAARATSSCVMHQQTMTAKDAYNPQKPTPSRISEGQPSSTAETKKERTKMLQGSARDTAANELRLLPYPRITAAAETRSPTAPNATMYATGYGASSKRCQMDAFRRWGGRRWSPSSSPETRGSR